MVRLRHGDWPDRLWIVRHGQSAGNVARDIAEAAGHELIDLANRDADTPLSAQGIEQSRALGDCPRKRGNGAERAAGPWRGRRDRSDAGLAGSPSDGAVPVAGSAARPGAAARQGAR